MAEEYGVKLKVTADTADAQASMDELLRQKSQRVQNAAGAASGGSASGGSGIDPKRVGKGLGQAFNKEVEDGPTGKMIGKAIAGFVLHQGLGSAFSFARTVGGDNTNVNRAEGSVGGALQFGTVGAMLGGPWGAAIGGLVGAASGLIGEYGKERQARQQTKFGMWQAANQADESLMAGLGSMAQNRLLGWQGSRENRIEWLTANRKDIQDRRQEASNRLSAFGGDTTSREYAYLQGEYTRLTGQYGQALSAEMQERMKPLYDSFEAGDFSDAFSKRGLTVGATVDVAGANERIIDQQQKMVDLLQRLVDSANAGAGVNGARLSEALRDIMDSTTLR